MKEIIELFKENLNHLLELGNYSIELEEISEAAGYIDGFIVFDGLRIKCSFNERKFICFHSGIVNDLNLKEVFNPYNEKICDEVFHKLSTSLFDKEIKEKEVELEKLKNRKKKYEKTA